MITIRVGDIAYGLCPCPPSMCPVTGIVATGNPSHIDTGNFTARMGDVVIFPCGTSIIMVGVPQNIQGGQPQALIGAPVSGAAQGMVITGNPRHFEG